MNQALINFFIFVGIFSFFVFIWLKGIENERKGEKIRKRALKRKSKTKKQEEDKPWITLPNPAMMLIYGIGIIYLGSLFYSFTMLASIIGPFGLIFLFLWLISHNKKKED